MADQPLGDVLDIIRRWQDEATWHLAYETSQLMREHRAKADQCARDARAMATRLVREHRTTGALHLEDVFRKAAQVHAGAAETFRQHVVAFHEELLSVKNYLRMRAPHLLRLVPPVNLMFDKPEGIRAFTEQMVELEGELLATVVDRPTASSQGAPPAEKDGSDYSSPDNYERDRWVYHQREAGRTVRQIMEDLERRAEPQKWQPLFSETAIREAANRIARYHGWPEVKGRSGRPRTKPR